MELEGPPIEIHIHTADGMVYHFYQDNQDEIARILSGIQPQKVFAQRHLLVAGTYFMAGFHSDEVTRIDLALDREIEWDFLHNLELVEEISPEEFEAMRQPEKLETRAAQRKIPVGEVVEFAGEIVMSDGQKIFLRILERVGLQIEQRQNIQNLFSGGGFHVKRREGGVIIINPLLITRWAFYPGLANVPKTAWKAHRVDWGKTDGRGSVFV